MIRFPWWLAVAFAATLAGSLRLPAPAWAQGTSAPRAAAASQAGGHALPSPTVRAARAGSIVLDGKLDEADWASIEPATDFRQAQPKPGDPATDRTEIRLLYDEVALYIGARMFDSQGRGGVRSRLVRRDQDAESDWIEVIFDTYHNHLGRTVFAVNPAGVRQDAGQATEFADESWDPVWEAKAVIDSLGWTAELRIPFSQLRFSRDSMQTWGMQVWRTTSRTNEVTMWSYWGPEEAGGPSRFGHVTDLSPGRGASRRLEILPYVVSQYSRLKPGPEGDPFYDESVGRIRAGGDLKYLLTSNLTLDATLNPDFGQVEVDPAVVNLSAFETFFPERRPFFVEGSGTFGFGGFSCFFCSNVSSLSLFYSRRIGRVPQGAVPAGTRFSDRPESSTILGAAKVTGRTGGGFTLGLLDALTAREEARIQLTDGTRTERDVEPLTNYFVGRLKKDFERGNLEFGTIGTSVFRSSDEPLIVDSLPRHAEAVGFDWNARWKDRTYQLQGNVAFTNVQGEASAITRLQRSSARYFNRPDRKGGDGFFSNQLDPTATVMRGIGGYTRFAKDAGRWLFETSVNWRSPGFEANELAFNTRADYLWFNTNVALSLARPTSWYRNYFLVAGTQREYNFDGDRTDFQMHIGAFGQLLNYWGLNAFVIRRTDNDDDRLLRGGPVVRRPGHWFFNLRANTDTRKRVSFSLNSSVAQGDLGSTGWSIFAGLDVLPASNVSISFQPSINRNRTQIQYVRQLADPTATDFYGTRYVLADLRQTTLGLDTRLNVTFTPTMTLELFAQPFISAIHYSRFKEFEAPRSRRLLVYGTDVGTVAKELDAAGTVTGYRIDPDGAGPAAEFTVSNPDFNFRSLRGNAVLRWEYRPGSTLYLVWTRNGSAFDPYVGDLSFSRDLGSLVDFQSDNIFLLKVSYWINR